MEVASEDPLLNGYFGQMHVRHFNNDHFLDHPLVGVSVPVPFL
jgi:hypothetical protein